MNIDSHQHFWAPARGDYFWMEGEAAAPIRRNVFPDQLEPLLKAHRVMWGSDRPVLELNGDYEKLRNASEAVVPKGPLREEILDGTAARLYRIAD